MDFQSNLVASLVYHDRFDYPMTKSDLSRWKCGKKTPDVKKVKIEYEDSYYFLSGRTKIIKMRKDREVVSERKLKIAQKAAKLLGKVPTVKMIGITGSLAMKNSDSGSDIDLIIITQKGMLWTTRLIVLVILITLRIPIRRFGDKNEKDKLCLNMWLDENDLIWPTTDRNCYTAHEIAQIIPIINREMTYEYYIWQNSWVLNFWPKAVNLGQKVKSRKRRKLNLLVSFFEILAFRVQYLYMRKKITNEVITSTHALFHPQRSRIFLDKK